jgi:flagellar FliL protein
MGRVIPLILALIGLAAGIGAGMVLRPAPETVQINPCENPASEDHAAAVTPDDHAGDTSAPNSDFVRMNNQFVVPVVREGRVESLVVMSLSLELKPGTSEAFYQREPKLRDAFLQVLFDHANSGGFSGVFTDSSKLAALRSALHEIAVKSVGPSILDVLVTDIVRQDI